MKKLLTAVMAAAMVLSLVACGSSSSSSAPAETTAAAAEAPAAEAPASLGKMTMGTGGTAGTYYAFGGVLGQYMKNKGGVDVTVVSTDGSKANIQGIDAGDYQLGTVQSDVMAYAWEGSKSFEEDGAIDTFRVIGGLYAETVQLVTMDPNIKSVADLKGKSVSIGAPGSGVYFNAIDVLSAAGLSEDDIKPQYLSFADSAEGLKDGKIDAGFIVAGAPTPAITELTTTNDAYLVPIDGEIGEKVLASCPYYTALAIPAGTYKGQDEDVMTVTVKATMIISADATEEQAYAVTAAIFDNIDDITAEHAKGAELSIENATSGMTAPFHAGAAKYFKEKGVDVETK
ncbi:MAG: TAXI family TRAP transporter solute-binding subunit [Lachnospiraceae bacterium]|nr:TAXI family TRAP transporter solute-binding subunit [Lachnospiraceae bacterium]MBQ2041426.1 TAXI family TRAP transporter solute-binding subunit [Lachnospiraceae bacterium]